MVGHFAPAAAEEGCVRQAACGTIDAVSAKGIPGNRDLVAFIGIVVAVPLVLFGLFMPFHDYAGNPKLERLVSSDSLVFSTIFAILTACVAVTPVVAWPRLVLRAVAAAVFVVALWNLMNVLSYHWWRSDLVFCPGGCS